MIDLKNKNALVTGGSAGLGASVCRQLAAEGVNLAINYSSSKDRAEDLAAELRDQYKVKVVVIQADVFGGAKAAEKLVEDAAEQLGGLNIVISNAGWTKIVPYENLDALDDELWDGCFQANIKTHFYLFRAAKKIFDANIDSGTFIVSASLAGRIVYGSSIPYAVSKAGLIHLVRMLAQSQGPKVRVHAVCPGLLMTGWGQRFPQERVDLTIEKSPIKQLADVDETAAHFVFLCKLATSTGTVVGIDGGLFA
ncbi:CIC11C00000002596 [Sungouiella intermedia]|uniref:CIC11C00000002596 n=1 Tax=Sungouiella intermedia TaxID=45354 RepID=A0A1L0D2M3_9ASCO|nr:CIC11C00000002596 [[Candida] intermedia]